jgi:NAD(P)-dependent dehydrogenase (short-subunit alcohol dehydrogenase family)
VTGGASGIGLGVVSALLTCGAQVTIGDVDEAALATAARDLDHPNLRTVRLDVTSATSVARALEQCRADLGGLDTLVNSAGVIGFWPMEQMTEEQWDRVLDVNLKGVFLCCRAAAPLLSASGRGRIVSISSDAGKKGYPLISAYCASKFGVIGFSKAIAGELAGHGVTVNCVCPIGVSSTKMGQKVLQWLEEQTGNRADAILVDREQTVPLRRMACTADVVNAVMFFISDASGFLTGEALNVDGGVLSTALIPGVGES